MSRWERKDDFKILSLCVSLSVNKAGNRTATEKLEFLRLPKTVSTLSESETPGARKSYLCFLFRELSDVTHTARFPPNRQTHTLKNLTRSQGSLALARCDSVHWNMKQNKREEETTHTLSWDKSRASLNIKYLVACSCRWNWSHAELDYF